MKKNLLPVYIFSIFLISCSQSQPVIEDITGEKSLKAEISLIQKDVNWAKELEGNRLNENISVSDKVTSGVQLSPFIVNVISDGTGEYPYFSDFGKLDYSSLTDVQLNRIKSFITLLSENIDNPSVSDFSNRYFFNYIFFRDSFLHILQNEFKIVVKDSSKNISAEDSNQNNGESSLENNSTAMNLINKYYIGQPEFSGNNVAVPLRLFCETGFIDVIIYLDTDDNSLIYDVEIGGWRKINE